MANEKTHNFTKRAAKNKSLDSEKNRLKKMLSDPLTEEELHTIKRLLEENA